HLGGRFRERCVQSRSRQGGARLRGTAHDGTCGGPTEERNSSDDEKNTRKAQCFHDQSPQISTGFTHCWIPNQGGRYGPSQRGELRTATLWQNRGCAALGGTSGRRRASKRTTINPLRGYQ